MLLSGSRICGEGQQATKEVLANLERWSIVTAAGGEYQMLDAHAEFARENLASRLDVRQSVVKRWAERISSHETVTSTGVTTLMRRKGIRG